jgi:hypothetical protein
MEIRADAHRLPVGTELIRCFSNPFAICRAYRSSPRWQRFVPPNHYWQVPGGGGDSQCGTWHEITPLATARNFTANGRIATSRETPLDDFTALSYPVTVTHVRPSVEQVWVLVSASFCASQAHRKSTKIMTVILWRIPPAQTATRDAASLNVGRMIELRTVYVTQFALLKV